MTGLRTAFERAGGLLERHPVASILLVVALVGVAVVGATGLTSETGDSAFVGSNPTLEDYEGAFDRGAIAVLVDGDISSPETLRAMDRFDRRMSGVEDVETVVSPADRVRRQYGRLPGSRADIERVLGDSETAVVRVVMAPDLDQSEQAPIYQDAVEAEEWARFPAGTDVTVTGEPAYNTQVGDLIQSSTRTLLALAVGLMIAALYLLFRGVRLKLLPIVSVFVAVVFTFGTMGYLGIPNSTLTSAVFPIIIGLGIDYSVQFHQRYEEELAAHRPSEALPRALAGIGPPVLVAMLAAALGFGATWLSTVGQPAFVWFAQTSMIGIAASFLTSLLVLVPVLTLYVRWRSDPEAESGADSPASDAGPDGPAATDGSGGVPGDGTDGGDAPGDASDADDPVGLLGRSLGRLARVTATNPGVVIALAGVLLASGLYASTTLDYVADTEEFVPDDLPALLDLQQLRDRTGGGADVRYPVLVSGGDLTNPRTLRWMDEFEQLAEGQPQVRDVETPADAVRRYNRGTLPATEAGVEATLARMPEPLRERYYSEGFAQITAITEPGLSPTQIISFAENTEASIELSRAPPGVDAELTGAGTLSPQLTYGQIVDRNTITLLGLAFIFGLLAVYYRHPVKSVAPLVPMVFVIGWQGLYMAVLDIEVSPLGASLGALTVGIGAEYTIIVMERYYEEKGKGASAIEAVEVAAERVGKAITVSGMTTVFGFSALLLSPFPIVSDFGFLTVGVIFLTLVGALVIMPVTLVTLDRLAAGLSGPGDGPTPRLKRAFESK